MELTEVTSQMKADQQGADTEGEDVSGRAQIEEADAHDEYVPDHSVSEAP
jgi:hypothetical protein